MIISFVDICLISKVILMPSSLTPDVEQNECSCASRDGWLILAHEPRRGFLLL